MLLHDIDVVVLQLTAEKPDCTFGLQERLEAGGAHSRSLDTLLLILYRLEMAKYLYCVRQRVERYNRTLWVYYLGEDARRVLDRKNNRPVLKEKTVVN